MSSNLSVLIHIIEATTAVGAAAEALVSDALVALHIAGATSAATVNRLKPITLEAVQTSLAVRVFVTVALACMALVPYCTAAATEVVQAKRIEAKAAKTRRTQGEP